jgi:glycosyltransferase involved in cell wall biosynthesis
MLFMGPFRYDPNLAGVRAFLLDALPRIRAAVPDVSLCILGGQQARARVADDPLFAQEGVQVHDHRDDIAAFLDNCAFTINPLSGIRGSAVKVIESLRCGRACVSTAEGARGFRDDAIPGLVIAGSVAAMIEPCIRLLQDVTHRHEIEAPDGAILDRFSWEQCARPLDALYVELMAGR